MDAIQTDKVGNYIINIRYSQWVSNPREWDNVWRFMFGHKKYDVPNETDFDFDDYDSWDELESALEEVYDYVIPVYMYDHSQVALSTGGFSCPFDSGRLGFACLNKEWIKVMGLEKRSEQELLGYLEEELMIYQQYLNGEVYEWEILDEHNELVEYSGDFYDFYEALDDATYYARSMTDRDKEKKEADAWAEFGLIDFSVAE